MIKFFNVFVHHPKAQIIKEVIWSPPLQSWIKCVIFMELQLAILEIQHVVGSSEIMKPIFMLLFEPLGHSNSYLVEINGD